jgi:hypothetical protein
MTTASPVASLSVSGNLPAGVSFNDNLDGTGTLSGTARVVGLFALTFTATNQAGTTQQAFTLAVSGRRLRVTPESVDFGTVSQGTIVSAPVALINFGETALDIKSIVLTGSSEYTLNNSCSNTLAPGKSCIVTITLNAESQGTPTGTLTVTDNAAGNPQQVSITANVLSPPK